MDNIMVDLETMSSSNRAAIIAIGAVAFDKDNLGAEFYVNVSLHSCMEVGLELSASTVKWWMLQNQEAREALYNPEPILLKTALISFTEFFNSVGTRKTTKLWAHATFDPPILSYVYELLEISQPYAYPLVRDVRTIYDLAYPNPLRVPIDDNMNKHNALSDAKHQALGVQQCWKKLSMNE